MDVEKLWSRTTQEAKRIIGRGVISGALALTTGLAADSQAKEIDYAPQQSGHTLVLPEIQVPTGDFEVINRGGVELTRDIWG